MSTAAPAPAPQRAQRPFSAEHFEQFLASREEPDWVTSARRAAWERYLALLSEPLDPEEWKRVDIRSLRADQFDLAPATDHVGIPGTVPRGTGSASGASVQALMEHRGAFVGQQWHLDGRATRTELTAELADRGVVFGDLARLVTTHGDLLRPYLATAVRPETDRISAWHSAYWTGGTVLYVPRNVELQQPLLSLIGQSRDRCADFSHTLVILEEGASATLLEETASTDLNAVGLHVGAVELILQPGSRLRYVQLQNWNQKTWHLAHNVARVDRNASLQWTVAGLGARTAHLHQHIHLDGPGAEAEVNGVTFAVDRQLLSYYTQQTHHAERARSDLLYKDVLRDRARVVWRGMIKVDPAAQKTDGYQRNDSLLMSADARADAIPGLEIEADDVRCTHGATAGQVDEEQLFYCMCRGLTRSEAMHLIVEGFFQRVFDRIPVELVRETLSHAVARKLGLGD